MEHQLWKAIVVLIRRFGKQAFSAHRKHDDVRIIETWFWAVVHDRPVSWRVVARIGPKASITMACRRLRRCRAACERRVFGSFSGESSKKFSLRVVASCSGLWTGNR